MRTQVHASRKPGRPGQAAEGGSALSALGAPSRSSGTLKGLWSMRKPSPAQWPGIVGPLLGSRVALLDAFKN